MKEESKHIKEELKDLKAEKLASLNKPKLVFPTNLEEELLAHIHAQKVSKKSNTVMRIFVRASMGIAAVLVLALLIWRPNLDQQELLSMDDLNEEELLYMLEHYMDDYATEDLATLASNDVNVFEFSELEESYFEQVIVDDVDISYDDLF